MKVVKLISLIVVLSCLVITIVGCAYSDDPNSLPDNAVNIKNVGNGWATFEWENKKFLYHKTSGGQEGYECITQLRDQ